MKYKFRGHVIDMDDIDTLIKTAKDRIKFGWTACGVCGKYGGDIYNDMRCGGCPVILISIWCGSTRSWYRDVCDVMDGSPEEEKLFK